jgi:uncharacterized protein (TIGR03086 family)
MTLAAAVEYAIAATATIPTEALSRQSPCGAWTVGDVLVHLVESLECLTIAMNFRVVSPLAPGAYRAPTDAQLLRKDLSSAGTSLIAASRRRRPRPGVSIAGLPLGHEHLVLVGAIEAAVHGWDAAHGADELLPIPGELAERLLSQLPTVVDDRTRSGSFAAPIPAPADASPADRLLAALGRQPPRS